MSRASATPDPPPVADRPALDALLRPRSVAIIGATERPGSVGAAVMRNAIDAGFAGPILAVNPNRRRVFDRSTVPRIGDAPHPVDLACICTPAATVPGLVRECGEASVGCIVVLTAGFREAGPAGTDLDRRVRAELDRFPRMRALGPNCVGLIVPPMGLNASFAHGGVRPGGVALLSQSGALCSAFLGWAQDEGIGFSHFVSVGNMLDIGFGDLLDDLASRPETTSIVLYVESITDAPHFLAAAGRCTARKPVIAYKAGRHAAGARAAASHTGAMAGEDAVCQAAFDEVGIVRVNRLDDLLATAELLGRGRWPAGPRLGIVTNAGGPGVIATDTLIAGRGVLANLSRSTMDALDEILPPHWSHANPVDVIGDATPRRLAQALECVVTDPGVDAALVIVTPQSMIDTTAAARAVAATALKGDKPVLGAWLGGGLVREGTAVLQDAGIPTYGSLEQAVDAFLCLAAHAAHERAASARDANPDAAAVLEQPHARAVAERFLASRQGVLGETDAKALLSMYGVEVAETRTAHTRAEAVAAARSLGHPAVLKVVSPQITHKTDVGGVVLDLRSDDAVGAAFDTIQRSVFEHRPDAIVEGVTVQRLLDRSNGIELIVGAKRDATFGPVVLVGAGGTTAELLGDRAIGLAPMDGDRAIRLLRSLRMAPLFDSFRGRPALDIEAAAAAIAGVSRLISELPCVQEIDANPVLVTPARAIAVDGRVVLADAATSARPGRARPTRSGR